MDLELEEDATVSHMLEGQEAFDEMMLSRALAPRVPNPFSGVGDVQSALWGRLQAWLLDDIEQLRQRNDGDLDPVQTAQVRAQIRYAKKILALANKRPG